MEDADGGHESRGWGVYIYPASEPCVLYTLRSDLHSTAQELHNLCRATAQNSLLPVSSLAGISHPGITIFFDLSS
jgi:hypothetical protein